MRDQESQSLSEYVERLELLLRVMTTITSQPDLDTLLRSILVEIKDLCRAEGGTLYLKDERGFLDFAWLINEPLGLDLKRGDAELDAFLARHAHLVHGVLDCELDPAGVRLEAS